MFSGLAAGTYTLTASKSGYAFAPSSRTVAVPPDASGQDFVGTPLTYAVAGHVSDGSGQPVSAVTVADGAGRRASLTGQRRSLHAQRAGGRHVHPDRQQERLQFRPQFAHGDCAAECHRAGLRGHSHHILGVRQGSRWQWQSDLLCHRYRRRRAQRVLTDSAWSLHAERAGGGHAHRDAQPGAATPSRRAR